jgi:hypothetical protein
MTFFKVSTKGVILNKKDCNRSSKVTLFPYIKLQVFRPDLNYLDLKGGPL